MHTATPLPVPCKRAPWNKGRLIGQTSPLKPKDVWAIRVRLQLQLQGRKRDLAVAVVEVDVETGQVTIERFVVVEDAGRLINPMIVEGQIHGGVAQGIANALYEKVIYDDHGNVLTGSLADYPVPTTAEIPSIEIHHLETLTEASVTGAKGVGEGGTIGAPAAVLNAVSDALAEARW